MDLLTSFLVVGLIGLFIMYSPNLGGGCFNWCDVGKAMMGIAIGNLATLAVKGPVTAVKVVA